MSVLKNARHERFAQAVAAGKKQVEAHREAGYVANDAHASRLAAKPAVRARIAEIQAAASQRAEITVERLSRDLMRIAATAESSGEPAGLSVARAALMDAAKLNGLIVDRKEIRTGDLDDLGVEEREAIRESIREELEIRTRGAGEDRSREVDRAVSTLQ